MKKKVPKLVANPGYNEDEDEEIEEEPPEGNTTLESIVNEKGSKDEIEQQDIAQTVIFAFEEN